MREPKDEQKLFSLEDFLNTVTYSAAARFPEGEIRLSNTNSSSGSHRLSEEQQHVANEVAAGPRGEVRGPVRVWLYSPKLARPRPEARRVPALGYCARTPHFRTRDPCHRPPLQLSIIFGLITLPWLLQHGLAREAMDCIKNRPAGGF